MQFMALLNADQTAAAMPSGRELMERMGHFMDDLPIAGLRLAGDGLRPTTRRARVRLTDGTLTVAEAASRQREEALQSYAVFDVKTPREAIEWAACFLQVLGCNECELRTL
jgi:hypothetical protein